MTHHGFWSTNYSLRQVGPTTWADKFEISAKSRVPTKSGATSASEFIAARRSN
jgi:hypothetical protein